MRPCQIALILLCLAPLACLSQEEETSRYVEFGLDQGPTEDLAEELFAMDPEVEAAAAPVQAPAPVPVPEVTLDAPPAQIQEVSETPETGTSATLLDQPAPAPENKAATAPLEAPSPTSPEEIQDQIGNGQAAAREVPQTKLFEWPSPSADTNFTTNSRVRRLRSR